MRTYQVILVIDDELDVLMTMAKMVRACGYGVLLPPPEFELDHLLAMNFDLLLTDLVMPKLDGWTIIREVRKVKPDIPIIAFSGYDPVTREPIRMPQNLGALIGADHFMPKPVRLEVLREAIISVFAKRRV